MKILISLLLIGALVSSLTGCDGNVLTNKPNSTIGDQFDNDGTPGLSFNSPLPNITSGNSSAYPVSGVCDPNGGDVTVVISSPEVTELIPCSLDGTFSGTIDVSTVTLNPPNVNATQGTATASASPVPVNDQTGPASAPTATAPGSYVGGGSNYNLPISCNEAGEVVSISGVGIDPSPQTYTCSGSGTENFPLTLANPVETADPNNLTISSIDEYGNPSGTTTMVNVPVDTQGPVVAVSNGGDIVQGQTASFTVTVTDLNFSTISYAVSTSGAESSSYTCNTNPCNITTGTISSTGALTLTVSANSVNDDIGNSGDSVLRSSSLTVNAAGALGFNNPLPTINTGNASTYPVSGSCDDALGDVTVNVTAPAVSQSIPCNAPGNFSGTIDLSGVTSSPANMSVSQGVNTVSASPNPINDQTPINTAPTVANQSPANGMSTNLSVNCTEAGEVLSFSGSGLNPSPQTHTCASPLSNPETVNLTFANPIETSDPNTITLSSADSNGNPTTNSTTFNLPIDNVVPAVVVAAGADIVEGNDASFTVTVTDGSSFTGFTPSVSSGSVSSGVCSSSPCAVTVTGASSGTLTMTVAIGAVVDAAGNSNAAAASDSLNVSTPSIINTSITSTDGDMDTWYEASDVLTVSIEYNAPVTVAGGVPSVPVTFSSSVKTATYTSGSGTSTLSFSVPIVSGDYQCSGDLALGSLALNGAIIQGLQGTDVNNSGLSASVSNGKVDAKGPTAASAIIDNGGAFNNLSSDLGWTQGSDECGLSAVQYGIGTTSGGEDIQEYFDIGTVNSYQAQSGIDTASFNLTANTSFYTSIRSRDIAGNLSPVITSSPWSFTCAVPWAGITRLLALDASELSSIIDENGNNSSHGSFTGNIQQWNDISGSNNHLVAPSASARPMYNPDSAAAGLDSSIEGDGSDDTLNKDITDITSDFTFYYVLKPLNPNPSQYQSYFSNNNSPSQNGAFQLDYGGTAGCAGKFRLLIRDGGGNKVLCGPDYDTNQHVFIIKYNDSSKVITLEVDGVQTDSKTLTNSAVFRWLRLFENRAGGSFQAAELYELNLVTQSLTPAQEQAISDNLICKWNVSL